MNEEEEWIKFMINNKKWDSKRGKWKFPKPNEYHTNVKDVWVKSDKGGYNPEKGEKGYWQNVFDGWEMRPMLFPYCQLCGKDLKEMRLEERNVIKFCCKDHSIEYVKRNKMRKERFGEENTGFFWHTDKGKRVFRKNVLVNILKNNEHKSIPLKARKSKWA